MFFGITKRATPHVAQLVVGVFGTRRLNRHGFVYCFFLAGAAMCKLHTFIVHNSLTVVKYIIPKLKAKYRSTSTTRGGQNGQRFINTIRSSSLIASSYSPSAAIAA